MRCDSKLLRRVAASLVFGSFFVAGTAVADHKPVVDPDNGYGPNDRPAFLFVSVAPRFEIPTIPRVSGFVRANADTMGSPVVRVNLGNYVAGDSIPTTRFGGLSPISIDLSTVPPDPSTGLPPDFDEHQFTILGSFRTLAPDSTVHMMTPYPGIIAPHVQEAYFTASAFLDDPGALPLFPTTVEVALFVYDHQGTANATIQEILDGMFGADPLSALELVCESPCEAEGILFPHEPGEEGLFNFHSMFDPETGVVAVDICLPVPIDIKPGNNSNTVNVGSEGVVAIAVLSTASFDAVEELDPSTVEAVLRDEHGELLSGVPALRWDFLDANGDKQLDVVFKFSVPDLVAGPNAPLTEMSGSIDFRGDTFAGMCVEGSDSVRIVPPNK